MKLKLLLLLLLSTSTYATQDECKIIEDAANLVMQLRQTNFDLKTFLNFNDQKIQPQQNLLERMISEAEAVPVYATSLGKNNAIDEFVEDWKRSCVESESLE
ncbi:MAG: hypothetical protein GAK29_04110 [Acinetobacter bereziniae]|uniref:Uncharacterized protein n=1 Tax=Acinetobacter bereziniae TaxID=106648 RepID=A0A833PBT1_ACIBZ|nr:MAG: hypothetical protein GAK29_04110 [Acinetobacter bereziniae]